MHKSSYTTSQTNAILESQPCEQWKYNVQVQKPQTTYVGHL